MRGRGVITRVGWVAGALALAVVCVSTAQNAGDPLVRGFENPPDSAKPRVWWHWMNGNITKDGIKADLEWMKRVGIGGFQNFDASLNTPQVVDKRLVYMTPAWKEAVKYTATLAEQLGLEMAIASSPGWSESGGPWVPAADAMKKYVWSETRVDGGHPFTGRLPKPPSTTGIYQNQVSTDRDGEALPEFYADAAVVAYRAPASDFSMLELEPKVTSSGGTFDLAALTNGDIVRSSLLPAAPAGEKAWIQVEFTQPQTVRGLSFMAIGGNGRTRQLEASDNGRQFRVVSPIPAGMRTIAFPATTARVFRITILTPPGEPDATASAAPAPAAAPPAGTQVAELVLHSAVVHRFQDKAAFTTATGIYGMATPSVPVADAVRKRDVVDLTTKMRPDGSLDWIPPQGRWVVLRIGYSLTGRQNSPASPEATGLEVDKLNRAHVRAYFDQYLNQYRDATGGLMGSRGLQYMVTDSWEAGAANWTEDMLSEFRVRRGYDMIPWLPALTGRVIESAEATDRFLWDFRQTLADMVVEYHYDQLTTILRERGMARYSESHESGRAFIGDGMDVKRLAAVPMSAMWISQPGRPSTRYEADVRESASVAHIYGQNLVAAESFTAGNAAYSYAPETLKPTADREMSAGLNRFVIHTSVHQPVDDKIPGLGLGPFGQWFTRHETWAELARPWTTYLARSSYMLQQGRFVADIAYYYGEDSNITALFGTTPPPIPAGYSFDYVNARALKDRVTVSGGNIITPTGMSYRVLALDPNARHMSLAVLKTIRALVKAGAIVVGARPVDSPSNQDDQDEFQSIVNEVWGPGAPEGQVFESGSVLDALRAQGVPPDFEYAKPRPETELAFVHRKLADGEAYWVSHRNARTEDVEATFRVKDRLPELWHADTGVTEPASYRVVGGRTIVPLHLEANDAVFVVFRKSTSVRSRALAPFAEARLGAVDGAWDVAFQPDRGAPDRIHLSELGSWSENPNAGVKYFSGTATYAKTIQVPAAWFQPDATLWLDLGDVKNLAQVTVNGRALGLFWKAPFRVDVTSALVPGENAIEISVTNLWVNRLVGDQQPDMLKKITYTALQFYRADSPLLPSGLLGPVQVVRTTAAR